MEQINSMGENIYREQVKSDNTTVASSYVKYSFIWPLLHVFVTKNTWQYS